MLGENREPVHQRITFTISSATQALRQAFSLARVLAYPLTSLDTTFSSMVAWSQAAPWLLDSWLDLHNVQKRWEAVSSHSPIPLVEIVLEVSTGLEIAAELTSNFSNKANVLLVLLCSEIVASPQELLESGDASDKARLVYCQALIALCKASLRSYSVGRMAASKLVQELALLSSHNSSIGDGTDISVRKPRRECRFAIDTDKV